MPTSTRAQLRRLVCTELQMPFIRRTGGSSTITASPTTTSFIDSKLVQDLDYWKGQWYFHITTGSVRLITRFDNALKKVTLEYATTAAPLVADEYEIHSVWNAYEIHTAINRAIADAYPSFFDVVTDETMVLKEDTLSYSLSALTSLPWIMTKVWLEQPDSVIRGTCTSGAVGYIADTSADFTAVTTNYKMSIYAGTGAGQVRSVTSKTGTTQLNTSTVWTTAPDSTSKYAVWDPTEQTNDWKRLQDVRFNAKENPTIMYLTDNYTGREGARIRLEYISIPTAMTVEGSTTTIPQEFILHKTLHYLYSQKINDNRADRQRYIDLQTYHFNQAEIYRQAHAFNMPEATMWTPSIGGSVRGTGVDGNPIGW